MEDDRILVSRVISGSNDAFEEVVVRHHRLCWSVIARLVNDPNEVHDLCQECFLQAYRSLHGFRFECSLKSWLARIAHSVACKHLRKKRELVMDAEEVSALLDDLRVDDSLEMDAIQRDDARQVRDAMDCLSEIERTILRMHYFEDLSVSQISTATGLASGTVKSHLFRARSAMKKHIDFSA